MPGAELEAIWKEFVQFANQGEWACAFEHWRLKQEKHLPATLALLEDEIGDGLRTVEPAESLSPVGHRYLCGEARAPALIIMTGYSKEQVALSIAFHHRVFKCRNFITVCSKDVSNYHKHQTCDEPNLIAHIQLAAPDLVHDSIRYGSQIRPHDCEIYIHNIDQTRGTEITDPGNPHLIFQELLRWLTDCGAQFDALAVDATGGQKTMDTAACAFAGYAGLPAFYLDTTDYEPRARRPNPCSSVYRRMLLPESVYSFSARQSAYESFRARDFHAARTILRELDDGISGSNLFREEDKENIKNAHGLIERCHDFMSGVALQVEHVPPPRPDPSGADRPGLEVEREARVDVRCGPLDVRWFKENEGKANKPDTPVYRLLAGCHGHDAETACAGRLRLLRYSVEEFYRLHAVWGGSIPDSPCTLSRTGTSPSVSGSDTTGFRDLIVSSRGLAELLCEALIHMCPGLEIKICRREEAKPCKQGKAHPGEQEEVKVHEQEPPACTSDLYEKFASHLECPGARFLVDPFAWHMSYQEKLNLLFQGKVEIRGLRIGAIEPLAGEHFVALRKPHNSSAPYLSIDGTMQVVGRDGAQIDKMLKCECSGSKSTISSFWLHDDWVDLRNATTHVRAPASDSLPDVLSASMVKWLPRIVETVYRLHLHKPDQFEGEGSRHSPRLPLDLSGLAAKKGLKPPPRNSVITWWSAPGLRPADVCPWHSREAELRRWLGLLAIEPEEQS